MKKIISLILALSLAMSLVACGTDAAKEKESATATTETTEGAVDDSKTYNVGVIQLVQHPALDTATEGFTDALKEKLGDKVEVNVQIGQTRVGLQMLVFAVDRHKVGGLYKAQDQLQLLLAGVAADV